ncbi:hypothetical protein SDC9_106466 [bioreactor metagenome]|uniref:Uncharacterized protein n=1 Tax=bioreactor metagenome TaxID=1076179 RepID=A0A645B4U0_9ZZZZ
MEHRLVDGKGGNDVPGGDGCADIAEDRGLVPDKHVGMGKTGIPKRRIAALHVLVLCRLVYRGESADLDAPMRVEGDSLQFGYFRKIDQDGGMHDVFPHPDENVRSSRLHHGLGTAFLQDLHR